MCVCRALGHGDNDSVGLPKLVKGATDKKEEVTTAPFT
jgi:hypothetical protein